MEAGVVRRKANRKSQKSKSLKNYKDNQENKKQAKSSALSAGHPFIPDNITPLVQSQQQPSRAPLRQLKGGPTQATLATSTPVITSTKEGLTEGTGSPTESLSYSTHDDLAESHPLSGHPAVSQSWNLAGSVDEVSIRQYHSQSYDTHRKRGRKGAAKQQQKRRKSFLQEEFEEWVRQTNEEFEEVDKHELFVTSTT